MSENTSQINSFKKFVTDPKGSSVTVLKESLDFLQKVVSEESSDSHSFPTIDVMIEIFSAFSSKIKPYVFKTIGKKICQELALCILKELVGNGPERAQSIELKIVKTKSGGKDVVIAEADDAEGGAPSSPRPRQVIDECTFELRNEKYGLSPNFKIRAQVQGAIRANASIENGPNFSTPSDEEEAAKERQMDVSCQMHAVLLLSRHY